MARDTSLAKHRAAGRERTGAATFASPRGHVAWRLRQLALALPALRTGDLALEQHIIHIRALGMVLCAAAAPFLHLGGHYLWIYTCLLFVAVYNTVFSRLVHAARPAWLVRIYAYGLFDTAAAFLIIAATGGIDSPFFAAFFLIVVHAGIRFGKNVGMLCAWLIGGCCGLLVVLHGSETAITANVGLRAGFILLTALFTGVLSDRARAAEATVADQLARTQALHTAGTALTGTLDWTDLSQLVTSHARRLAEAEIAILEFHDVLPESGLPERITDVTAAGAFLAKLLVQRSRPLRDAPPPGMEPTIHALPDATDLLGPIARTLPPASLVRAPILLHRRWVGDLLLVRLASQPPFQAADVATISAYATQAGLALEGARLYGRVHEQATTDPVTALPNHRSIKERLDQEVARAKRHHRPLTVLMLDLDHFKAFNDTFGHAVGDDALRAVAGVLKTETRRGDAAARYGGEEFVVLLPETDAAEGAAIAERIRLGVAQCARGDGELLPHNVTVSIGVATFPDHAQERDALLQAADLTMYTAKYLGRNQVCTADELGTPRGAEALVAQLTQHLLISTSDWGPHIVTALERRFFRLAALSSASAERAALPDPGVGQPATVQLVTALAAAIDAKDPYTNGHSKHVAALAADLALAAGCDDELVEIARVGGQLHDIGKIGIPESILHKPDRLTEAEWAIMKTHPDIGARILGPINSLRRAIPLVRHHHERWDGHGYPHGLCGEAIPLGARIIGICDAYDTMVSDRPYRRALDPDEAIRRLRESAGSQFDPALVETFAAMRGLGPRRSATVPLEASA